MAMGKAVVATGVGGNPELVTEGVTGFLVPPADPEAVARRMEVLLGDPTLRASMGEAARAQVERRHRIESMVRANQDLYLETASRRQIRRRAPLREWVKRIVARVLVGSGALSVGRRLQPPGLTLLTYHRVLPLHEVRTYPFGGMVIARDEFEGQVAHLARRHHVLPLPEAISRLAEGSLPPRAVAITFDDGYQDNYEHALPILRRYGLPAAFFVVTDAIDGHCRLWWDVVAEAVTMGAEQLDPQPLAGLPPWVRAAFQSSGPGSGEAATDLVRRLNDTAREERHSVLAAIQEAARGPGQAGRRIMLSWDEAREMVANGMHFGTHTKTHAFLDEIGEEEALAEVSGSIARISEALHLDTHILAYPRGRSSPARYPVLRQAGIEAAMTTQLGTNRPGCDLLSLRRMDVGFSRQDLGFDSAVFDAELAGSFGVDGRS
jgi:peptidoglycan/xylan/chitin deacetylase (PgdA/CDA1 family)